MRRLRVYGHCDVNDAKSRARMRPSTSISSDVSVTYVPLYRPHETQTPMLCVADSARLSLRLIFVMQRSRLTVIDALRRTIYA